MKKTIFERIKKTEKEKLMKINVNKNAYDIQTSCIEWSKKALTEEEILKIKNTAFENGILLENLYVIFGIMMRDCILEELNIHISKIDEYAPDK